ncbi:sugar fermentation stimulation protein [Phytophthora infestans T30-4]|uniref:Sugar fermentation stimulation protein n=1 Tax=Phytophthora infestans (strain T30-4) TaxID=403677 RepID=D0N6G8_PHYIT|nr:sugar fermentation stimulation protein [Phytophthora infestans T30-4]EEY70659.1 sugar fermentation stimulation protein [Phytophthora infestans T30-4]|eukprot:XP_002998313.1 sugar fermentation stimulation protein [Phytophthora infestans T30-4]
MASTRSVGSAVIKMQLRSRKRDFASSATVTSTSSASSTNTPKRRAVKSKATSMGAKAIGQKVEVVAPTSSKFPVLSAFKERVDHTSSDSKVLFKYSNLVPARLIRRYKRFLADVVVTVYCPNTGPMIGLLDGLPNARVQLSKSDDPKRKYAYTLEMIQIHNGERNVWVGVHSTSANRMVEQALTSRWFPELGAYDSVRREVNFAKNSRVDFVLTTNNADGTVAHEKYVEVKSVTLALAGSEDTSRCAVFPDTVSTRAQKHVTELTELFGAIIFLVQRDDCNTFAPSIQHDKKFAELCAVAATRGVQLLGYSCALEPDEANTNGAVRLVGPLPLQSRD